MCKNWFTIFSVKVTARAYITRLGLIVQHHKSECPVQKMGLLFKVKVTAEVQNVSDCLSRRYCPEPQNILVPNLVWLCSIISQNVLEKNWFTVFNVKVTIRAYIIKILLFLLYLLNYWLVCNHTWFDSMAS